MSIPTVHATIQAPIAAPRRMAVIAVVLLGTLLPLSSGCSEAEISHPQVVTETSPPDVTGEAVQVRTPRDILNITMGRPVPELPWLDDPPPGYPAPPDYQGASFLPLSIAWLNNSTELSGIWNEQPPKTTVRLITADGELDLTDLIDSKAYVALPPSAANDYTIDVDFDGVTQTLTPDGSLDAGPATALYDLAVSDNHCAEITNSTNPPERYWDVRQHRARSLWVDCIARSAAVPYLPGHGWATTDRPADDSSDRTPPLWHLLRIQADVELLTVAKPLDTSGSDNCRQVTRPELSLKVAGDPELITLPRVDELPELILAYKAAETHSWPSTQVTLTIQCATTDGLRPITLTRRLDFEH